MVTFDPDQLAQEAFRITLKGDTIIAYPGTGRAEDGTALVPSMSLAIKTYLMVCKKVDERTLYYLPAFSPEK